MPVSPMPCPVELKAQENTTCAPHIIRYYLQWIENPWAVADDAPYIKVGYDVMILGLTQEQEDFLRNEPIPSGRDLIGKWIYEFIGGHRIKIYQENDKYYTEYYFTSGY